MVVHTADYSRLRGAIAFTPIFWHLDKRSGEAEFVAIREIVNDYVAQEGPAYLVGHDWMINQWLMYYLQIQGYRIVEEDTYANVPEHGQRIVLSKNDNDVVYLIRWLPDETLEFPSLLEDEIEVMPSVLYIGPSYIVEDVARIHVEYLTEVFTLQHWEQLVRFRVLRLSQSPSTGRIDEVQ